MFKLFSRVTASRPTTALRSISLFSGALGGTAQMEPSARSYVPRNPDGPFPYSKADLTPMDAGNDASFYLPPRFVTHIDDNAISNLKRYYDAELPRQGTILDFCSSWVSHYPPDVFKAAKRRGEHVAKAEQDNAESALVVYGTGMNEAELKANPILWSWTVQDLNHDPIVHLADEVELDASTCVVSIDYLTKPVEVLKGIFAQTKEGGRVHLAISNRCFPTKAVGRWLKVDEQDRLEMVGDYLYWAGWRNIEIVEIVKGGFLYDPLWVVRAKKVAASS